MASPAPSDDTVPAGNTGRRRGRKGGALDAGAPPARRTAEVSRDAKDETAPLDESATVDGDDAEKKLPCSNAPADCASADEGPTEEDPEQEEGKVVREHAERDVDGEDPLDKKEATGARRRTATPETWTSIATRPPSLPCRRKPPDARPQASLPRRARTPPPPRERRGAPPTGREERATPAMIRPRVQQ